MNEFVFLVQTYVLSNTAIGPTMRVWIVSMAMQVPMIISRDPVTRAQQAVEFVDWLENQPTLPNNYGRPDWLPHYWQQRPE